MRKSKKNLNTKEIEKVFLNDPSPCGVIAVYMYKKKERNIVNVMKRQERNVAVDERGEGRGEDENISEVGGSEDVMLRNIHQKDD